MTEVMTDELQEAQKKIFSPEEINEMFDNGFLAKLQELSRRINTDLYPDKDINCYICRMELKFEDQDNDLTYDGIKDKVNLKLQPVFQEEIDKSEIKSAAQTKLQNIIDEAQAEYESEIKRIDGDESGDLGDDAS